MLKNNVTCIVGHIVHQFGTALGFRAMSMVILNDEENLWYATISEVVAIQQNFDAARNQRHQRASGSLQVLVIFIAIGDASQETSYVPAVVIYQRFGLREPLFTFNIVLSLVSYDQCSLSIVVLLSLP